MEVHFKTAGDIKSTRYRAYIITESRMSQNADSGEREGSWQRGNGYRAFRVESRNP